jgi:hypothetical protein
MKQINTLPAIHFIPFSKINEKCPILLISSTPAGNAVKDKLHLTIDVQPEPMQATTPHWDSLITPQPLFSEVVYAIGCGLVADARKYMAFTLGLPRVVLPTALFSGCFIYRNSRHP